MSRATRFSPEVRERAIRMVGEQTPAHASQWAAITSIAEKIGCNPETLRSWIRRAERDLMIAVRVSRISHLRPVWGPGGVILIGARAVGQIARRTVLGRDTKQIPTGSVDHPLTVWRQAVVCDLRGVEVTNPLIRIDESW